MTTLPYLYQGPTFQLWSLLSTWISKVLSNCNKKTYDNVEGGHHTKGANWQVLSNLTIDGNLNRCDYLFSQPRLKNISLSIIDYQSFFLNEKINPLIISFKNISCERHHGGFSISVESFIYYAQHEVYRPLVFTLQAHVYA
jgi:hypothetical protein